MKITVYVNKPFGASSPVQEDAGHPGQQGERREGNICIGKREAEEEDELASA
jgi:hypothetical protein